jgi:hypothetical protein
MLEKKKKYKTKVIEHELQARASLDNIIKSLLLNVKEIEHPALIANKIGIFISDMLKVNLINLYEAYLLNFEEIKFRRNSYIALGWNGRVKISICLAILNQRLLAKIFNDEDVYGLLWEWGIEAMKLNSEKRPHYIMDRYNVFLDLRDSSELLKELLKIRMNYQSLNDNEGPFHIEVFPYNFYSPEKILLENEYNVYDKTIDKKIENLIIELNLK